MSESLSPVFLLVGDPFLVEEKAKALTQTVQKKYGQEIIPQTYSLSECDLKTVLVQARTLPFFAPAQIFRLKQADELKKAEVEWIADYLKDPTEGSYLFFEAQTLEKDSDLTGQIRKAGQVFLLEESQKKDVSSRFIQEKMKRAGKSLTPQAFARLQEEGRENPVFLDSILDRLMIYAGEQAQITEEMVDLFEENFNSVGVFQLTDAIANRKTGSALELLNRLMDDDENDEIALLGLLHWQIRRFWQAKVLQEDQAPESLIAKKCKLSPRQSSFFMRQLQSFSRKQLEKALEGLFQLDWKMKTGRVVNRIAFEAWLVETTT